MSFLFVSRPSFNFGGHNVCASICAPANLEAGSHTRHLHATAAVSEIKCGDDSGIVVPAGNLLLKLSASKLASLSEPQRKKLSQDFNALIKAFSKVHDATLAIVPSEALEGKILYWSCDDELVSVLRHNTRFSGHCCADAVEADGFFLNSQMAKVRPPSPEIEPLPVSYLLIRWPILCFLLRSSSLCFQKSSWIIRSLLGKQRTCLIT